MDFVRCFTDGAWQKETLNARIGWVIEIPNFKRKLQKSDYVVFVGSPLIAEAIAIKMALADAIDLEIRKLCVASDSKSLIQTITTKTLCPKIYGVLLDIFNLISFFSEIRFMYVPREANAQADALAKRALEGIERDQPRNVRDSFS
ncbi:hypothetical protein EUTSA_v10002326mg [Eutrema salsugineum]|uniref:RNase H type-1 domain-containing protein n=1 Tax=Eutrema salsugineum TaxID=72664 RepID=V4NUE1_EUTSA|nr:uncharacterized protein LOC18025707 [Eutrema salsugineum]ESQ50376.1 hypothetical protein EUTSA_v10002326mg [Eutrema salsugineum]